ncbi:MAG: metal ABC transporter substrate-binding protein [bacterium]
MRLLLALLLTLVALPAQALTVVASTSDLAAIARDVVGSDGEVVAMSKASQDPHYVDARPSLTLALNKADLVLVNGLELEVGWLPTLLTNARNTKVLPGSEGYFDASTFVNLLEVPTGKIDRAQGDIHPGGNPHFLHDPRAAAKVAVALGDRLAKLDAKHADAFRARAKEFAQKADGLASTWKSKFDALPATSRKVVAYHASLPYLFDWLDLHQVITVEPKPGIQPNPGHVAKVLKAMRESGAHVVVQEAYYPTKTSQTVAQMAKGHVVVIPGGAEPNETYLQRADRTAKEVYDALKK